MNHKLQFIKLCASKWAKKNNAPGLSLQKGKTGCVLSAGEDGNGWKQVITDAKSSVGKKDLVSPAAPRCQDIPHTNEKSQVPQMRYLTFLAGAEGLEPSARGFGVDVETR